MVRKIYLPSPREPSGATWLINCLLELGIRTFRYSPDGMWRRKNGRWHVNEHEQFLRKWLPALSDHESFEFREDVEVQWMHEWRTPRHESSEILYFVRDPRDALYSRYKREAPQTTFAEFVEFPDVRTLLDKSLNWRLFNENWMGHPRLNVVKFEDYKANGARTLETALKAVGLEYPHAEIERAVAASTYERAAQSEREYRKEHPEDEQVINRSGRPQEWESGEMDARVIARVEFTCADLMRRLGYRCSIDRPFGTDLQSHVSRLGFFKSVVMENAGLLACNKERVDEDVVSTTLAFMSRLDADKLMRAGLPAHELRQLRASMSEYGGTIDSRLGRVFKDATAVAAARDRQPLMKRVQRGAMRRLRRLIGAGA